MQPESTQESFDFDNFMNWLYANRKPVAIGGAILAVALVGFALFNWKKTQSELDANAALFELPSLVGAHPETANVSAQDFQKIADQFPGTGAANRAEIIAAGLLFTEGKYAEAEKQFATIMGENQGGALQSEAALGVAAQ